MAVLLLLLLFILVLVIIVIAVITADNVSDGGGRRNVIPAPGNPQWLYPSSCTPPCIFCGRAFVPITSLSNYSNGL